MVDKVPPGEQLELPGISTVKNKIIHRLAQQYNHEKCEAKDAADRAKETGEKLVQRMQLAMIKVYNVAGVRVELSTLDKAAVKISSNASGLDEGTEE